MKRLFPSALCLLAFLLFSGSTLVKAQQTTPSNESGHVIIIQKTKHDDGTVTVKKKSLEKGQDARAYFDKLNLQDESGKSEIVIITDEKDKTTATEEEMIFFMRNAKRHGDAAADQYNDMEELKIILRDHAEIDVQRENDKKTFLGVYPASGENGVKITGVVDGSGAKAAGLQTDDVMTSINGNAIRTNSDLRRELAKYQPDDVVNIDFLRNGEAKVAQVTLSSPKANSNSYRYQISHSARAERDPCKVFYGVYVGSYGEGLEGVGVSGIVKDGEWPAETAGLRKGDRIIAIDAIPVNSHHELVTERDKHKPGEAFTFTILRDGYPIDIESRFKSCPGQTEEPVEEAVTEEVQPEPQPVEQIENTLQLEELNAFPNPTYGMLNVKFRGEAVPTTVMISDINGKAVFQENLKSFDGYYNREINLNDASPGTLLLSIRQGEKVVTASIVLLNRA